MKSFNLKYIIMACAMLHNLCIVRNDPCNWRWLPTVEKLELKCNNFSRQQSNKESNEKCYKNCKLVVGKPSFRIINETFSKNLFVVLNSYEGSLV